ncbi:MAG: DUF3019 domain-containing protein [Gammaproteobacteria bacterium]|nr:MAG: DUF3019 domain-containing protein [Gammaproteobacteria bacterium]
MRRLVILLLILLPAISNADGEMQLKVRPVLCIIDQRTPHCQMSFLVLWQSVETGYYCLYNDFGQAPLRCWTEQRSGKLSDERTVNREFSYWMAGDDNQSPLAMVVVEVLRMDSNDRRRKRRSRHVWDIL